MLIRLLCLSQWHFLIAIISIKWQNHSRWDFSNLLWRRASPFTWALDFSISCKVDAGLPIVSLLVWVVFFLISPLTLSLFPAVASFFGTFGAEFGRVWGRIRLFSTEPITLGRFGCSLPSNQNNRIYLCIYKGLQHLYSCIWMLF